jgi:hypothetical protein
MHALTTQLDLNWLDRPRFTFVSSLFSPPCLRQIKRIWGGWEIISPAASGTDAQVQPFDALTFSPETSAHPASAAVFEQDEALVLDVGEAKQEAGGGANAGVFDSFRNDSLSKWFVVNSPSELALAEVPYILCSR